ncbi:MAG: DUF695 domain-containing protein [Candidatus Dormiibacterota bacterium]
MSDQPDNLRPDAVTEFWTWWGTAKHRIAAAIANQSVRNEVDDISAAVKRLHPGFAWELGPGRSAQHSLTVSPEGDLGLRRLTAIWLASAPPRDQTWEYFASRQASPVLSLDIGGSSLSPEEFAVAHQYDESRERFNVWLYHPRFHKLPPQAVSQALFLTLDQSLGEDEVERWISSLQAVLSRPPNAVSLNEFVAAVEAARMRATGEQYTLGQGRSRDGGPVLVNVNMALKQINHLDHVYHLIAVIGLGEPDGNGMPGNVEAESLNQMEDALTSALGENAVALGRVTWGGRRELYFFVRDTAAAEAATTAWAQQAAPWGTSHVVRYDPKWWAAREGVYTAMAPGTAN